MSIEELIKSRQISFLENDSGVEPTSSTDHDRKSEIFQRVRQRIADNREFFLSAMEQDMEYIRNHIWKLIEDETEQHRHQWLLSSYERAELLEQLMHSMFGYGILEPLIHDPSITEIMVNGLDKIFIEREGKFQQAKDRRGSPLRFEHEDELLHVIEKIVSPLNRKINESDPIVDARLPNGSRVNAVLSPIALDGSTITIRKFPEKPYSMEQLIEFGALTSEIADWLRFLVEARYNIIISGGTGSGKTTFLNALSMYIPVQSRIITIEDAAELKLAKAENMVRLETRPPNVENKGEITIRDLVKTALRMRPDRIIIGEVRGGEALDMLQAMNTGHDGSLSTGHANSGSDMVNRLETMVLMAGLELPLLAIRQQIASAVEIIIHLNKTKDGKRRVVEILEVVGVRDGAVEMQSLYTWDYTEQVLVSTGVPMKKLNK